MAAVLIVELPQIASDRLRGKFRRELEDAMQSDGHDRSVR
jgi:hypothetical protein